MSAYSLPIYLFYRMLAGITCLVLCGFAFYNWQTIPTSLFSLVLGIFLALYWGAMFWGSPSMLTGDWEKFLPDYIWSWKPSLLLLIGLVPLEILFFFLNMGVAIVSVLIIAPAYVSVAIPLAVLGSFLIWFAHAVGMARVSLRMRKTGTKGTLGAASERFYR